MQVRLMPNLKLLAGDIACGCVIVLFACAFLAAVGLLVAVDVKIMAWMFGL
jgi:hypothetical protein